jgi:serine/threonine protein kinase
MNVFLTRKNKKYIQKTTKKRKISVEKLPKCPRHRIFGMETYKINCAKNLLLGYQSIKGAEETSTSENDFVHVILSKLKDYNKPVIVKIYDKDNFHLHIETNILKTISGYRNAAQLICDFSCNDDKNRWITKIKRHSLFCNGGPHALHFFIYEYIPNGDVSDFVKANSNDTKKICSLLLQIACVIIELAFDFNIYHGDINSGNILVDTNIDGKIAYCIDGEIYEIKSYGIMPKFIDYGRSNFYKEMPKCSHVWFDIILAFGTIYPYVKDNSLKEKILHISKQVDIDFSSMKQYYLLLESIIM